ncbi:MAG: hypothetical protein JW797_12690 [Bradymonadales bacterium]|nr:hypothetical protein [Bradymonadales bacterium]
MITPLTSSALGEGAASELLRLLYGSSAIEVEDTLQRYSRLLQQYEKRFGSAPHHLFSAPGRAELGGNHTDHNRGLVIAAAIHLDTVAAVSPARDRIITLFSEGYPGVCQIDLADLAFRPSEIGTTSGLVRGIAVRFRELGLAVGGFDAVVSSRVATGSGLSSSAAFEVLIGDIQNRLFNQGELSPIDLARIGQYAEHHYFGKPCGLMDQIACSTGGAVAIDLEDPELPGVRLLPIDLEGHGYSLAIVHTGESHADLSNEYGAIPREMQAVAKALGHEWLRQVEAEEIEGEMDRLRQVAGDRALLRALHFLQENRRVEQQIAAIQQGDLPRLVALVHESGQSSQKWLQNSFSLSSPHQQGITLALCLTEEFLQQTGDGACRVHGGGFAGTILVLLPQRFFPEYQSRMTRVFGPGSVTPLRIRNQGVLELHVGVSVGGS